MVNHPKQLGSMTVQKKKPNSVVEIVSNEFHLKLRIILWIYCKNMPKCQR